MPLLHDATAANLPTSLRWVFANVAARDGATVTAGDIGRLAFVTDLKILCVLESNSPVAWRALAADPYRSTTPTAQALVYLQSPDASAWSVGIDNDGNLVTTKV